MNTRSIFYILNENNQPVPATNEQASEWFENEVYRKRRIVGKSDLAGGDVRVSTVFMVIDHGMSGTPILFESMIFGGPMDEHQVRYYTWEEAEQGHAELVTMMEWMVGLGVAEELSTD